MLASIDLNTATPWTLRHCVVILFYLIALHIDNRYWIFILIVVNITDMECDCLFVFSSTCYFSELRLLSVQYRFFS